MNIKEFDKNGNELKGAALKSRLKKKAATMVLEGTVKVASEALPPEAKIADIILRASWKIVGKAVSKKIWEGTKAAAAATADAASKGFAWCKKHGHPKKNRVRRAGDRRKN